MKKKKKTILLEDAEKNTKKDKRNLLKASLLGRSFEDMTVEEFRLAVKAIFIELGWESDGKIK